MTISSLAGYTALLNLQKQTNTTSTSTTDSSNASSSSASVGDEILSILKSSQTTTDPLLQDTVTLSAAAQGLPTSTEPQTYDAKGLLKQMQTIQSNLALNDPLLTDSTDSDFDDGTNSTTNTSPGSAFNSIL